MIATPISRPSDNRRRIYSTRLIARRGRGCSTSAAATGGFWRQPPRAGRRRSASRFRRRRWRRVDLNVNLCNYRELFTSNAYRQWEHSFDGVIANGSLEHFVQCEDAAAGQTDAMYTEFFEICHRLLRPGGKLATTAIHARRAGQVNPAELIAGPERWPKGSVNYHASNLHRSFGGWFPEPGQLEQCAEGRFRLTAAEDGTHDYFLTSEYWMRRIKRSLALDPRSWPTAVRTFVRQPRATWRMLKCLLWDESWNYQFRDPAPAQLWRHTWTAV
jgi:hypothetical protein